MHTLIRGFAGPTSFNVAFPLAQFWFWERLPYLLEEKIKKKKIIWNVISFNQLMMRVWLMNVSFELTETNFKWITELSFTLIYTTAGWMYKLMRKKNRFHFQRRLSIMCFWAMQISMTPAISAHLRCLAKTFWGTKKKKKYAGNRKFRKRITNLDPSEQPA